ncbi:MAG: GAF domain-containing SpoIIE family protein phosphatase [Chitinophagales bacterium]
MPIAGLNVMDMLRDQLKLKQLEIDALLEVTKAINSNKSTSALFELFHRTLRDQIGVDNMLLVSNNGDDWEPVIGDKLNSELNPDLIKTLLHFDKLTDLTVLNGELPEYLKQYDILIPVFHKDNPLAYLLMSNPRVESYEPLEDKIKFAQTITNIITVAIENKRLFKKEVEQLAFKRELEVAAQVQNMLIPHNLPKNDNVQLDAIYMPHQNIGGDYYDFIQLSEDEIFFCIADISGKGIAAALLMANFQAQIRELTKRNPATIEEYMQELNTAVLMSTKGEKFITLFLGKYNRKTRILKYVNSGHNPPILINSNGYKFLDKGTTILGMFDKLPSVKLGQIPIVENTAIICYTDGLTDVVNEHNQVFALNKLIELVEKNYKEDVTVLNQMIINEIMQFKGLDGEVSDDITVLSIKILGGNKK